MDQGMLSLDVITQIHSPPIQYSPIPLSLSSSFKSSSFKSSSFKSSSSSTTTKTTTTTTIHSAIHFASPTEETLHWATQVLLLMRFLERSPLGPVLVMDFKASQFLRDSLGRFKASDLDTIRVLQPDELGGLSHGKRCKGNGDCSTYAFRSPEFSCSNGTCVGYTTRSNMYHACNLWLKPLLTALKRANTGVQSIASTLVSSSSAISSSSSAISSSSSSSSLMGSISISSNHLSARLQALQQQQHHSETPSTSSLPTQAVKTNNSQGKRNVQLIDEILTKCELAQISAAEALELLRLIQL